ncbi:hypothetical protein SAMN05216270_10365 [Glycomyces harbinensis]|uniref:Uncharacterized protein n=1 Tax=Glycomyces harbinensis TaxID=58114 RepID=A0A1G6TNV1_9ACTN|nr:hypothetical protein SAMN05216270_10365 [Glycomyces harbinensis]
MLSAACGLGGRRNSQGRRRRRGEGWHGVGGGIERRGGAGSGGRRRTGGVGVGWCCGAWVLDAECECSVPVWVLRGVPVWERIGVRTRVWDSYRRRPVYADYAKPLAESRSSVGSPDATAPSISGLVCGRSGSAIETSQQYGAERRIGWGALGAGITSNAFRLVLATRHTPQAKVSRSATCDDHDQSASAPDPRAPRQSRPTPSKHYQHSGAAPARLKGRAPCAATHAIGANPPGPTPRASCTGTRQGWQHQSRNGNPEQEQEQGGDRNRAWGRGGAQRSTITTGAERRRPRHDHHEHAHQHHHGAPRGNDHAAHADAPLRLHRPDPRTACPTRLPSCNRRRPEPRPTRRPRPPPTPPQPRLFIAAARTSPEAVLGVANARQTRRASLRRRPLEPRPKRCPTSPTQPRTPSTPLLQWRPN